MAERVGRSGDSARRRRAMIATGVAGVLGGVVLFVLVLVFVADDPDTEVRLGDEVFEVGDAASLAEQVEESGPLLFPDLLERDLVVYVQHLGGRRWTAFRAYVSSQRCLVEWQPRPRTFRDACVDRTYPADGAGLPHYRTTVDADGVVRVDLRASCPARRPC